MFFVSVLYLFVPFLGTVRVHWLFIQHRPLSSLLRLSLFQPIWYLELLPPTYTPRSARAGVGKPCCWFLCGPQAQNGCVQFSIVGNSQKKKNSSGHMKIIGNSNFSVHKVVLEQRHISLFVYCLWQPPSYTGWLRSCKRNHMALKARNIYRLVL